MTAELSVGVLIERLSDADPTVRRDAAEGLAELRHEASGALDALIIALDDPDGEVRVAAVHAIGALDPRETEEALKWALASADYRVQLAVHSLIQGTAKLRGPDSTLWRDPAIGRSE
jgi:HEAT repeat protein